MIILVFSALLWVIAPACLPQRARRDGTARAGLKEAWVDFLHLIPRLAVGVIGAGFIARAMPQDLVTQWLGHLDRHDGHGAGDARGALTPGAPSSASRSAPRR